jgi:hypothetical protein
MNESKLILLLVAMSTFIVGVMTGERSKGSFFRPWGDDGHVYVGDKVRFKKYAKYSELYNSCESMYVIGLQAVTSDNVAWILMEKCSEFPGTEWASISTDVVPQESLEREVK